MSYSSRVTLGVFAVIIALFLLFSCGARADEACKETIADFPVYTARLAVENHTTVQWRQLDQEQTAKFVGLLIENNLVPGTIVVPDRVIVWVTQNNPVFAFMYAYNDKGCYTGHMKHLSPIVLVAMARALGVETIDQLGFEKLGGSDT